MVKFTDFEYEFNLAHLPWIGGSLLVGYVLVNAIYQLWFSPLSKIPGPWHAAISHFWLTSQTMGGKRIFAVDELHKKYGPYVRISPTEIAIADINSVRTIHSIQDPYTKDNFYERLTGGIDALFAITSNERHKSRRRAYGNGFSKTNMVLLEPVIRKHVNTCIRKVKRDLDAGKVVDIMQWIQFMSTDVIGEISYGFDFGMLENETIVPIIQDLLLIMLIGGVRVEIPALGPLQWLISFIPHPSIQWFVGCNDRVVAYGDETLAKFQREVKNCKDGKVKPSLFTRIIDDMNNPDCKHRLTELELRHEATNNIIAGSDTVTITGTFMIWAILRNPEIRKKLEEEFATLDGDFTDKKLETLPYLKLVIKETLRLYTAAQMGLPRVVPKGGRQLGPYWFKEGTTVTSQAYTNHRDPTVFEEPFTFKPERWLNPTKEMEESYTPFGGASRECIGQHLGYMELRLIAAVLLTECPDVELADSTTDESMDLENYFVIKPKSHKCELKKGKSLKA